VDQRCQGDGKHFGAIAEDEDEVGIVLRQYAGECDHRLAACSGHVGRRISGDEMPDRDKLQFSVPREMVGGVAGGGGLVIATHQADCLAAKFGRQGAEERSVDAGIGAAGGDDGDGVEPGGR